MFSGFTTRVEPAIPTPAGVRYPDLVAWKGDKCVVIDTTIVADNYDPDDAHERKVVYYDQPAIKTWCAEVSRVPAGNVQVSACDCSHGVEFRPRVQSESCWRTESQRLIGV